MPNQIRDLYYQLFNTLSASRKKNQLETELHEKQDLIVDTLNNAFTYEELHKALKEKTAQYFEDAKNSQPENSTIFMIKDYISRNYMNDTLSVKDISGHVYLSASYVCTFFKSETGQTLNQYLTEYRMEKAKQLPFRSQIQDFRDFFQGRLYGWQLLRKKLQKILRLFPV